MAKSYSIGTFDKELDASDLAALRIMLETQGWDALCKLLAQGRDNSMSLAMAPDCSEIEWHQQQGVVGLYNDLISDLKTWVKDAEEVASDPVVTE